MQDTINIFNTIAGLITSLGVIVGSFIAVSKWGKRKISKWFSNILNDVFEEKLEPIKKVSRRTLRTDIENMCEKYNDRGSITIDEHRELTQAKEDYAGVKGNGSTLCIVNEILSLPVNYPPI
jgi:hypothetical protein